MTLRIHGQRPLKTPPGRQTRPTTAKVRAAVFNIWQGSISECRWLDLCSGSGAMGAEALVRGASMVVGIEKSPKACKFIRQNWQEVAQAWQQFQVICGDVVMLAAQFENYGFDHIYFDPPYDSPIYLPVITQVLQLNLLGPGGEMAIECRTGHVPDLRGLVTYRQKVYGSTTLVLFSNEQS